MNTLLIIIALHTFTARASETDIKLGGFSLASENYQSGGFELKEKGVAAVVEPYDNENGGDDEGLGDPKKSPEPKFIKGTWKKTKDGIEITYSKYKDELKFEKECSNYSGYPCFRFKRSLVTTKEKSLLNFDYPYINWDWTVPAGAHTPTKKCIDDCAEMFRNGTLKKGMDQNACVDKMCK